MNRGASDDDPEEDVPNNHSYQLCLCGSVFVAAFGQVPGTLLSLLDSAGFDAGLGGGGWERI